ncbi:site-specific integrase [Citrifermentans bemidjiense]|nr:site-specific integrase [Citrifermentans bemidjiense]
MENEASLRLLLDVIGDGAIENIDRKTASLLRDALCILPANVYKVLPGIPVSRVLEELKTGCSSHPPMSTTTVNKHLSRFSTLLAYCVREGILRSNPAEGMTLKRKRKADEERKAYSPQDLKMIFENLRYHDSEPERYWIPILSMYTGLRLDELCQLYTEDVTEYDGVHCISVADTQDKKVKTLSSRRIVPVHPRLVKLGFLAYVRKAKANGQLRLWMNLKRRDADGYGSAYGKVFQRFNRKYITNDPLKTFHSFRHTFANSLKQQGVQESLIAEILGHTNPSITTGRYGKRFQPRVLLEAIKKLEFELD